MCAAVVDIVGARRNELETVHLLGRWLGVRSRVLQGWSAPQYLMPPVAAPEQVMEDHTRPVLSLAWSSTHLFSGSYDHTIRVWDLQTLRKVHIMQGACRNSCLRLDLDPRCALSCETFQSRCWLGAGCACVVLCHV